MSTDFEKGVKTDKEDWPAVIVKYDVQSRRLKYKYVRALVQKPDINWGQIFKSTKWKKVLKGHKKREHS